MKTPKPYCTDKEKIKAYVLGCDPTGFDKKGNRLEFEFVFDIGGDDRYFAGILSNLNELGLTLKDVYVQNLVMEYQKKETSKNEEWDKLANASIEDRKKEFDAVDPNKTIPVFLTSELLYKILLKPDQKRYYAKELYNNKEIVPIAAKDNQLGRPLIPLYRHYVYALKTTQQKYRNYIKNYISI